MTTIEITWADGTKNTVGGTRKLTKTAIVNTIKELLTHKQVVQITIK